MAQAEVTITIKRKVIIEVSGDTFDPNAEFDPSVWVTLVKAKALVEHDDRDEITDISAAWHYEH